MAGRAGRSTAFAVWVAASSLLAIVSCLPSAAAIGPSLALNVSPPEVTGTPTASSSGQANFSGAVDLFSNPVGAAQLVVDFVSSSGWQVSPPGYTWRVTEAGRFPFNFTVEVPPDSVAGRSDAVEVTASYRVGGVSAYTESMTVHAMAGPYYAASVRRVSPPVVMEPGKNYGVEFELSNDGNARASFIFLLPDKEVMDKLRAQIEVPDGPAIAGQNTTIVEFLIEPGGTSPAGKYAVPVQMELRDRMGTLFAVVNFTMDLEVNNLGIYQGWLPNWNLRTPYTLGVYAFVLLSLWFALHAFKAFRRDRRSGSGFVVELRKGLGRSRFLGLVRGALGRVRRMPVRRKAPAPLRPDEVKGRASARPQRHR